MKRLGRIIKLNWFIKEKKSLLKHINCLDIYSEISVVHNKLAVTPPFFIALDSPTNLE